MSRPGLYGLLAAGRERFNPSRVRVAGPAVLSHRGQLLVGGPGGITALELEADEPASLMLDGLELCHRSRRSRGRTLYFGSSGAGAPRGDRGGELLWSASR
jgi:hypothetical protein